MAAAAAAAHPRPGRPQRLHPARHHPVRDPRAALTHAVSVQGTDDGSFWQAKASQMFVALFHAAALAGGDLRMVARWVFHDDTEYDDTAATYLRDLRDSVVLRLDGTLVRHKVRGIPTALVRADLIHRPGLRQQPLQWGAICLVCFAPARFPSASIGVPASWFRSDLAAALQHGPPVAGRGPGGLAAAYREWKAS